MRKFIFPFAVLISLSTLPAHAEPASIKASFIGPGIFATADGCKKLQALALGGAQNVGTVPETLTEEGFEGWEGSCTFLSVTEVEPGKIWKTEMQCIEGPEETTETDIFEKQTDGTLKVTQDKQVTVLQRCDAGKGN